MFPDYAFWQKRLDKPNQQFWLLLKMGISSWKHLKNDPSCLIPITYHDWTSPPKTKSKNWRRNDGSTDTCILVQPSKQDLDAYIIIYQYIAVSWYVRTIDGQSFGKKKAEFMDFFQDHPTVPSWIVWRQS